MEVRQEEEVAGALEGGGAVDVKIFKFLLVLCEILER